MLEKNRILDNRYKIIDLIGEGGMSNVYLAEDIILDRKVAIKVLHTQLARREKFIERFKREAKAVTTLLHRNIVEVYDVGCSEGTYFIVMELLEGLTLKDYLKKNKHITINKVIFITKEICKGLALAHTNGIYHRDLKPQNIFIKNDGSIKIMDFGIAYHQDATPLTQTNAVMGSVHYLSPEQAKGESADIQTDIYSLGIVMYEMLIGETPFKGDSAVNVVLKHIRESIPYLRSQREDIPQSMENIVLKATAKSKKNRYRTLEELIFDLEHVFDKDKINQPRVFFGVTDTYDFKDNENEVDSKTEIDVTKSKKKPRKKRFKVMIYLLLLFLFLLFSFIYYDFATFTKMPNINNKTLEEARIILVNKDLCLGIVSYEPSNNVLEGRVISSDIIENQKVKKNSLVNVKISKGKIIKIEDYIGQDIHSVIKELKEHNIKYDIEYVSPETKNQKEDIILKQSKIPGTDFNITNDTLILTVSQRKTYVLDDLKGRTKDEALNYAKDRSLSVSMEYDYDESLPEGTVIKMIDYWPGKKIKEDGVFSILVSKGKKPTTKPQNENNENNTNNNKPRLFNILYFDI